MVINGANSTILNDSCWSYIPVHEPATMSPLIVILLLAIDAIIVLSNLIVVCVIISNRHLLSSTGNLFILSLAISDLTLGLLVLPPSIVNHTLNLWPFGRWTCRAWLALDVWLCTASIYNLLVITVDRFVAVTKPLSYKALITANKVTCMILVAWTLSFCVCIPVIFLDRPELPECRCSHMSNTPAFALTSSAISFYAPFLIIIYFYYRIYRQVRHVTCSTSNGFIKLSESVFCSSNSNHHHNNNNSSSSLASTTTGSQVSRLRQLQFADGEGSLKSIVSRDSVISDGLRVHKGGYCSRDSLSKTTNIVPVITVTTGSNHELNILAVSSSPAVAGNRGGSNIRPRSQTWEGNTRCRLMSSNKRLITRRIIDEEGRSRTGSYVLTLPDGNNGNKRQELSTWKYYQRRLSSELKTLKTVGIVTGCVLLSWMGFCFIYTLETLNVYRFNHDIVSFFMWLGYVNSAVNPFIYAGYNRQYRQSLKKLFKFRTNVDLLRQPGDATSLLFSPSSNGSVRNQ